MLTIDPQARTSMAHDLDAGRPTEIDALQGRIIEMGQVKAIPTPLCATVLKSIKQAEGADLCGPVTPADLRR